MWQIHKWGYGVQLCVAGVRLKERTAYHRLASVYYNLQQYEMAEDLYLKSVSFCPAVMQHPLEVRYFTQLYCRLGNLTLHKLKVQGEMYTRLWYITELPHHIQSVHDTLDFLW